MFFLHYVDSNNTFLNMPLETGKREKTQVLLPLCGSGPAHIPRDCTIAKHNVPHAASVSNTQALLLIFANVTFVTSSSIFKRQKLTAVWPVLDYRSLTHTRPRGGVCSPAIPLHTGCDVGRDTDTTERTKKEKTRLCRSEDATSVTQIVRRSGDQTA